MPSRYGSVAVTDGRIVDVDATVVGGTIVYRDGTPTGARPGTVLRGGRVR